MSPKPGRLSFALLLLAMTFLATFSVPPAQAQEYSGLVGVGLYTNTAPHPMGAACAIVSNAEGTTGSLNCAEIRGDGSNQPVYVFATGLAQKLKDFGKLRIYGLAQTGIARSDSVLSGLFSSGIGATHDLPWGDLQLFVAIQARKAPAIGDWKPAGIIGLKKSFRAQ